MKSHPFFEEVLEEVAKRICEADRKEITGE
jgi:hypothetical protein